MKEKGEILIGRKAKDDATMNFVSKQAQEAILDPNVPEFYKHYVVRAAVDALWKIEERRNPYNAKRTDGGEIEQSHTIYKAK